MSFNKSIKHTTNTNTNTKTINDIEKIDALWVMSYASVAKDHATKKIIGYNCYCNECKKQSVSGNGGIAFNTAEDLLAHRNMKAFLCPCNCRIHVCEQRSSIMSHLSEYHSEVLDKLMMEGLDPHKSWIYHDAFSYTLTKPLPEFDDKSPLEQSAIILSLKSPKRVDVPPSPIPQSPVPSEFPDLTGQKLIQHHKNKTFTPVNKSWSKINKPDFKSLADVIMEQQEEKQTDDEPILYAQENMRKEKQCPHGIHCTKKDRPFACALNHDNNGDIINMGTILTDDIICPFERPPFFRCNDGRCTKIHLEHRADFIEKKKKEFFDKKTTEHTIEEIKEPVESSVLSINENGIDIVLSKTSAIAISTILHNLETNISEMINDNFNISDIIEGEWVDVKKKTRKNKQSEIEPIEVD